MMTQAEMNTEMVIAKIEEYNGNVSSCARSIGCARNTLYAYISNHPTCQQALDNARESMIDNVESVLYSKAKDGEGWAVCFFLKTQGKRRGYVERQEITGEDGNELLIKVKYDEPAN